MNICRIVPVRPAMATLLRERRPERLSAGGRVLDRISAAEIDRGTLPRLLERWSEGELRRIREQVD